MTSYFRFLKRFSWGDSGGVCVYGGVDFLILINNILDLNVKPNQMWSWHDALQEKTLLRV